MVKSKDVESPTQVLARHLGFLFYLVFLGLHMSLGFYYFEAQGSNFRSLLGFLSYIKSNAEQMPVYRIQVLFQDPTNRDNSLSNTIYRWAGSSQGYLCDGVYQTGECNTTTKSSTYIYDTNVRNFYYLPGTITANGVTTNYSVSFVITRCPTTGCPASAYTTTPITPTQFTIQLDATTSNYYLYINGIKELHDFSLYNLSIGISPPCLNTNVNSFLPTYLYFSLYSVQTTCDTFGTVPNSIAVTQNTAGTNDGLLSLNVKQVFLQNEMSITLSDLGKPYKSIPSTTSPVNFNMYLLPKISNSTTVTNAAQCAVPSNLDNVPYYSNYINQTGLSMFILRQVFIALLIPVPIIEMVMGCMKNPAVVSIGYASKGLLVFNMLLMIIEGGIVSNMYTNKTNLMNQIRNIGWMNCFSSSTINQLFMSFPSVFYTSQDDYNYYAYVYMWISCVGLFIIILLCVKLGMDMCVKKRKYGEYDVDPNEVNQPYDPTVAYVPYQDQQQLQYYPGENQFMSGSQIGGMSGYPQDQFLQPQLSLVKSVSNRPRQLTTDKKNNLSTIKEYKNNSESKIQNAPQKGQNYEMQVLSSSHQENSDEED